MVRHSRYSDMPCGIDSEQPYILTERNNTIHNNIQVYSEDNRYGWPLPPPRKTRNCESNNEPVYNRLHFL